MEIKIDREKLKGKSLMLATPMYGGNCKGEFARCVMELALVCRDFGVPFNTIFTYNASLITRGRNDLARVFLEGDKSHMIFIDADIVFDPMDVIACLASDHELIGGPYPMKDIDWPWVKDLILAKPDVTEAELEDMARMYHFNYFRDQRMDYDRSQLLEVWNVSTGFMLIARSVYEKIAAKWPERTYITNYAKDMTRGVRNKTYNYFHTDVEDDELLSEDYYFCKRWREAGGKIWLAPWMKMQHIGDRTYGGCGLETSDVADHIVRTYRSWRRNATS